MRLWGALWAARGRASRAILAIAVLSLVARCSGGSSAGPAGAGTGIGPAGGTIRSADGTVTLEIPPGALGSMTPVEIQPIANTAPGGLGAAFRLTPAGTTCSVPMQLTFALTPADLQGTTLEAIGVGYAGPDGWRSFDDVERTTAAVSIRTTHFSDWSRLLGWQLRPPEKRVRSGERVTLKVVDCEPSEDSDGLTSLVPDCAPDELLVPLVSGWAVDGIPGGSLAVGLLSDDGDTAEYLAPIVVAEETHAVSVKFLPLRSSQGVNLLVSNITVAGVNEFTIEGDLEARPSFPGQRFYDVCPWGAASTGWTEDGVRFAVGENPDGTWSWTDLVNLPTEFDRELQPEGGWASVRLDAEPDLFDASAVSVQPAGPSSPLINVRIFGTKTTGACTATPPNGSPVTLEAMSSPDEPVFSFDSTKSTQTFGTPGQGWYFVVHRR